MAKFVVGDSQQVLINHPTFGSIQLDLKSGSDFNFRKGGPQASDADDNISTLGSNVKQVNQSKWMFSCTILTDDRDRVIDYLQNISGDPEDATFIVPHINGSTRSGVGSPVGELNLNLQTGELPLTCNGGGTFEPIGV